MAHEDKSALGWFAFAVSIAALALATFGLRSGSVSGAEATATTAVTVDVTLAEFTITPQMITLPLDGGTLNITNAGSAVHSLSIPEVGVKTGDIAAGATMKVKVGRVAAGMYPVLCEVPGHAANGMTASLMIGGDGTGSAEAPSSTTMSWQEMDKVMADVAGQFPAKTQGHGGDRLEPTVLADGTKEFDIEAKIVKWEVSPGKLVDAWTYNGVVPAPEMHVEDGDKVRIVLKNSLPESTSMHLHGIRVPNAMDGVDPFTQQPIPPGGSFTYEFVAKGPAVGIYHSHHDALVQVTNGLFGAFTIGEMPIPQVLKDQGFGTVDKRMNMVLNDAGTIGLSLNGKSFPATEPTTLTVGQVLEVNYLNEGLMAHPMHLHQPTGWIIAKDGVPLLEPMPSDTINIAPGERYTVLYKAVDPGVWAWHCHILNHAEGPTGMFGMVTALIVKE
ncbi:MAG: multicopper oxidase domain-containing protein [Ilumatobacteraceae bacterium]